MPRNCSRARAGVLALVCCSSTFLFVPPRTLAQTTTVSIGGTITDASGGALPKATVEAAVAGRVVATTASTETGRYRLDVARGVPFELRVRLDQFADFSAAIQGPSEDLTRHVTLQVGRVSDTLVVTASRGADARSAVTAPVTVATAADLHALGAAQLTDVLRFVPGLAVEGNGREGGLTSIFSRGGESDHTLVLVDGVRVNQQGGYVDVSRLAAAEIERVEVVRGAQSSLWGSDAIGAVVQVFTRRAGALDPPRLSGSVEAGTFDTRRADVRLAGGARQAMDYQLGAAFRTTDGAFQDVLPEQDSFEQTTFDAGIGATLGARASVRTGVRYSRALGRLAQPITYGARERGGRYDTTDLSWHAGLAHAIGARFSGTASVSYFRYESINADTILDAPFSTYAVLEGTPDALFPHGVRLVRLVDETEFDDLAAAGATPGPGQFLASATSFPFTFSAPVTFDRPSIRYQGDYAWAPGQRLSAGYEWEREAFDLDPANSASTGFGVDTHAVFVQQQSTFADRWFLTAGVRVDARDRDDTFVSPRLSAGGFLVPLREGRLSSLKVFGNVGAGIKAPNLYERFGAAWADPNPDLRVERSRTGDAGVEATFASQRLRALALYFHSDYADQINYRSGSIGDGIPEYVNVDRTRARGLEFEIALQRPVVGGLTAGATYALVDTAILENINSSTLQYRVGQPLVRRPKHTGTLRASYGAGRATVNADLRLVGQRHDNSFLFLATVPNAQYPEMFFPEITVNPGYAVAGLGVDVRLDGGMTVYIRGNNITNTTYDSVLGYPGMPRTVVVGARFDLGLNSGRR